MNILGENFMDPHVTSANMDPYRFGGLSLRPPSQKGKLSLLIAALWPYVECYILLFLYDSQLCSHSLYCNKDNKRLEHFIYWVPNLGFLLDHFDKMSILCCR
ncbi:hypothetical protein GDO78_010868 [Eleutherodactylus coqui]|uniref:Uncharacterized protein n=1 Tax=Eleutherodactylus coqui TaxID=57060 RepID=A0A8J6K5S5_ELECQ|nr:hypothetical protein GDO78_010868 [Eleutherodactylus coqui]